MTDADDPSGGTARPDPTTAGTPAEFVEAMRRLKRWSGLGFRRLEQRAGAMGDALPRSTLTAALSRDTLPREDLVAAFARTCGCDKDEVERWVAVRRRIVAAPPGPAPTAAGAAVVPAQLPPAIASFAGRTRHLDLLNALLVGADRGGTPPTVVITAIAGTAGIGKTSLAVHWGHLVAVRFPDGQLYVNLRGFDPSGSAMSPAEAVRGFLDALAVPPQRVPASLDAQVGLYRSLLAGRRVLVVLDNARDAEQVRPLLPGSPGCLAVVTSRNQLTSLVATESACLVTLNLLSVAEARELLARRLGADRVAAEPGAADEIVTGCARLPLALSIVAARAAANAALPLTVLANELREVRGSLDALHGGDAATDIRGVFSWSYQTLSDPAARLFRLLGLHPGPDIAAPAAASLAGIPLEQVRPLLAELTRDHLVEQHNPGRYAFHDLLRAYASELAHVVDAGTDRRAAVHRVLDHYLHTASTADRLLNPHRYQITPPAPQPGVTLGDIAGHRQAMAWFTTEHPALLAAIGRAAKDGFDTHTWQLVWTLATFFERRAHWHDWAGAQRIALDAARRLADRAAQARAHRGLAYAQNLLGRYDDAHTHLRCALDLFAELGEQIEVAHAHIAIAWGFERQGRHGEALSHSQRALDLYQANGHIPGQANALNAIGWGYSQSGDHQQAVEYCLRALTLTGEIGDQVNEAHTWDSLGYAYHHLGRHRRAVTCYQHALDLWGDLGDQSGEGRTLIRLGDTHHAAAEHDAAHDVWRQALTVLDEINHPDADQVRAKLHHLDQRQSDNQRGRVQGT